MAHELQHSKYLQVIAPVAIVDDASWTTNEIDTAGYNYLTVVVSIGATDIAFAALKMQQSDTSGSGFADLTGVLDSDGDTDIDGTASTLPTATDDNKLFIFQVDLRGKKRYFDLVATAGDGTAGTFASAYAILSKADDAPTSSANMGAINVLRG